MCEWVVLFSHYSLSLSLSSSLSLLLLISLYKDFIFFSHFQSKPTQKKKRASKPIPSSSQRFPWSVVCFLLLKDCFFLVFFFSSSFSLVFVCFLSLNGNLVFHVFWISGSFGLFDRSLASGLNKWKNYQNLVMRFTQDFVMVRCVEVSPTVHLHAPKIWAS